MSSFVIDRHYPGGPLGLDRSRDGLFQPFPRTHRLRPSLFRCKVGVHIGLFEACSTFTGDYGLSARRVAKATRLSRWLRRFRFLHRRSDNYRLALIKLTNSTGAIRRRRQLSPHVLTFPHDAYQEGRRVPPAGRRTGAGDPVDQLLWSSPASRSHQKFPCARSRGRSGPRPSLGRPSAGLADGPACRPPPPISPHLSAARSEAVRPGPGGGGVEARPWWRRPRYPSSLGRFRPVPVGVPPSCSAIATRLSSVRAC